MTNPPSQQKKDVAKERRAKPKLQLQLQLQPLKKRVETQREGQDLHNLDMGAGRVQVTRFHTRSSTSHLNLISYIISDNVPNYS